MYEIKAPDDAPVDSYIYFEAISLIKTGVSLFIAEDLTQLSEEEAPITCEVQVNEIIAAKSPHRFFVNFRSKDSDVGKFFFQVSYSKTWSEDNIANRRCSDQGESVFHS